MNAVMPAPRDRVPRTTPLTTAWQRGYAAVPMLAWQVHYAGLGPEPPPLPNPYRTEEARRAFAEGAAAARREAQRVAAQRIAERPDHGSGAGA